MTMLCACSDEQMTESTEDFDLEDKPDLGYEFVQGQIYHILVDEYLATDDEKNPDVNVLYREYQVYDGVRNNVYRKTKSISLPKETATSSEAKEYLRTCCAEWLRLEPWTVLSEKVNAQWAREGYLGEAEYWSGSPQGLTVEQVKQIKQ